MQLTAYFVKWRATLLEVNSLKPNPNSERERQFRRRLFTSSMKREIRHFQTVVVQWRQRNVQKCAARAKLLFLYNLLIKPNAFLCFRYCSHRRILGPFINSTTDKYGSVPFIWMETLKKAFRTTLGGSTG